MGITERIQRFEGSLKKREPGMRASLVAKIADKVRFLAQIAYERHIENGVSELGDILAAAWRADFGWIKLDPATISPEEKKRIIEILMKLRAIGDSEGCYMFLSEILDEVLTDIVNHDVVRALDKKSPAA